MSRTSGLTRAALVLALLYTSACDNENPVAAPLPSAPPAAHGPLATTVAWGVAPPEKKVAIGDNAQSYVFTATVTGGVPPYTLTWQFGDGTPFGSGNPITHQFHQPGTYRVWVTVADAVGTVARSDVNGPLEVEVSASRFVLTCFVGPLSGNAPLDAELDAVADGNVGVVSWKWDFGDGSSVTSRRTRHLYAPPGSRAFTATATAVDGLQRKESCSRVITVAVCPGRTTYLSLDVTIFGSLHIAGWLLPVPAGQDYRDVIQAEIDLLASVGIAFTVNSVAFSGCGP